MKLNIFKILVISFIGISLFSCDYNSSIMMKTKKGYNYNPPPSNTSEEYVISPSDILQVKLYTNEGTLLIDFTAIKDQQASVPRSVDITYLVEFDGFTKLPIIGMTEVRGMTVKQVETMLEEKYAKYYIKPYVQVKVINKRVTVFPGGSNQAKIVPLTNNNMRLIEALGAVGGLTKLAKAHRIKLIRGNLKDPQVFLFDFSTLEGIKQSDFVLQANDIIYVEPRSDYLQELVRDIAPIISLITSTITLIVILDNVNKP